MPPPRPLPKHKGKATIGPSLSCPRGVSCSEPSLLKRYLSFEILNSRWSDIYECWPMRSRYRTTRQP